MNVKIIETGKMEELSLIDPKNNVDWATDFISDGGNKHDDDGNTLMSQSDFDFWSDACDKQQTIDDYLYSLDASKSEELYNRILQAVDGYPDMEDALNITLAIISDHKLIGRVWGELTKDQQKALLAFASPVSGIDDRIVLAGPCIVDFDDHLATVGRVEGDEIIIDEGAILYDPIA